MARTAPRTNVPCSDAFAPELPSTRGGRGFEARMARANALKARWAETHCTPSRASMFGGAALRGWVEYPVGRQGCTGGLFVAGIPYSMAYQGVADRPCGA